MPLLRLDLHNHSCASRDSKASVDELIETALQLGLDGFALTDHDSTAANAEAMEKGTAAGLVVIPGCEVSTRAGHVLGLFLEEAIEPCASVRQSLARLRQVGALNVVSHPLRKGGGMARQVIEGNLDLIDGLEALNPDNTPFGNRVAWQIGREYGRLQTGGSDTHTVRNMGYAVTLVNAADRSLEAVRRALETRRARPCGRHAPPCNCARCLVYCVLEPIARSPRFEALPGHDRVMREANRMLRQMFFSSGREMRW
jgi:predicted metal-dependent phosphoesterase TrpH